MEKKEKEQQQEKDIRSLEFEKDNYPNDYKFLVQKLKNIKEVINLLEKNLFNNET